MTFWETLAVEIIAIIIGSFFGFLGALFIFSKQLKSETEDSFSFYIEKYDQGSDYIRLYLYIKNNSKISKIIRTLTINGYFSDEYQAIPYMQEYIALNPNEIKQYKIQLDIEKHKIKNYHLPITYVNEKGEKIKETIEIQ